MARPTKYTQTAVKKICEAIQMGATYEHAAGYGGVSYDAFNDWMRTKSQFLQAIKAAEAKAAMIWLAKIEKAASETWQAAAWKLERRFPDAYGRREVGALEATASAGPGGKGVVLALRYVNNWRNPYDHDVLTDGADHAAVVASEDAPDASSPDGD